MAIDTEKIRSAIAQGKKYIYHFYFKVNFMSYEKTTPHLTGNSDIVVVFQHHRK